VLGPGSGPELLPSYLQYWNILDGGGGEGQAAPLQQPAEVRRRARGIPHQLACSRPLRCAAVHLARPCPTHLHPIHTHTLQGAEQLQPLLDGVELGGDGSDSEASWWEGGDGDGDDASGGSPGARAGSQYRLTPRVLSFVGPFQGILWTPPGGQIRLLLPTLADLQPPAATSMWLACRTPTLCSQ
jgi:hypothetical protein